MRLARAKGVVRRITLNKFKKKYTEKQLDCREGTCIQCGKCCELAFKCPFLNKSRMCRIYNVWRPTHCRTFPLDKRDIKEIDGECGYLFT
ncbi:MAG: YkgJ family cysteine cluster protein [Deltaproteobacteria bacterium]|nr:YkgJ family cysteine cluster protein [Deltaproteobacteria bacterium]